MVVHLVVVVVDVVVVHLPSDVVVVHLPSDVVVVVVNVVVVHLPSNEALSLWNVQGMLWALVECDLRECALFLYRNGWIGKDAI